MPDPLTVTAAITLAGKAVGQVSKLIQSGREIEDCTKHLSRWFECCSDINKARERAENPPFFKKLTNSSSIQAEAMEAVIAQKKMRDQRAQLRELIMWQWGADEWNNLLAQEKRIREQRQKLIHDRIVLKQKILDFVAIILFMLFFLCLVVGMIWVFQQGGSSE